MIPETGKGATMRSRTAPTLVLVLLAAACGNAGPDPDDYSQETPRQAVFRWAAAMYQMDKDAVLATLHGTEREMAFAGDFMDFMTAIHEFREAVLSEWGSDGWRRFTDDGGAKLSYNREWKEDALRDAEIRIDGDTARLRYEGEMLQLVRREGRWYLDAGILSQPGQNPDAFPKIAAALDRARDRVGEEGVTAESLDAELGRSMLEIMMEGRGSPANLREMMEKAIREGNVLPPK